eukprot:scaffold52683_cov69-Phaeocystis_antarctica.AAC.3
MHAAWTPGYMHNRVTCTMGVACTMHGLRLNLCFYHGIYDGPFWLTSERKARILARCAPRAAARRCPIDPKLLLVLKYLFRCSAAATRPCLARTTAARNRRLPATGGMHPPWRVYGQATGPSRSGGSWRATK